MIKKDEKLCATKYCRNKRAPQRTICNTCKARRVRENRPEYYYFNALRSNAKRRGKEFTLTFEQFKQFCKETDYINKKGRLAHKYSIDRIKSYLGYSIDNIQIMTVSENSTKKDHEYLF